MNWIHAYSEYETLYNMKMPMPRYQDFVYFISFGSGVQTACSDLKKKQTNWIRYKQYVNDLLSTNIFLRFGVRIRFVGIGFRILSKPTSERFSTWIICTRVHLGIGIEIVDPAIYTKSYCLRCFDRWSCMSIDALPFF